jgi:hypothetical protein
VYSEAVGATDCRAAKGCVFDLQLTLNSRSLDAFNVVSPGNAGVVLNPGANGVKVVFKKEVTCGAEAKLLLKRVRVPVPGEIQLAEEASDTELSLGKCDQCYKRC